MKSACLLFTLGLAVAFQSLFGQTPRPSNSNTIAAGQSSSATEALPSFKDDFSVEIWGVGQSAAGNMWYQDGEYHMHAVRGRFIVMYGPDTKDYSTENATVRVTVRSPSGNSPSSGYGVVVHGETKKRQLEDYGFLIYTVGQTQYKIVMHKGGTEKNLVAWTPSEAIRSGTQPNQLEVRNKDRSLDFYINGRYLATIIDTEGWLRGRVGFYTSQTNEIAFDDLEITRDPKSSPSPGPSPSPGGNEGEVLESVRTKTDLYPADADAKKEIDAALKLAASDHKRVLLVFGGNWCYDCHVLDRALHDGKAGKIVSESFLLVHVDIGEGEKNPDLVKQYKINLDKGVPVVAILGSNGKLLYSSGDGEFEAARKMMKKDLVAFLLLWKGSAPEKTGP